MKTFLKVAIGIILVAALCVGIYFFVERPKNTPAEPKIEVETTTEEVEVEESSTVEEVVEESITEENNN